MAFIKENKNFKGRTVQESPSFVGSLTPVRNFRGFATQAAVGVAAGFGGKAVTVASKGGAPGALLSAAVVGLAVGEGINQTFLDQSLLDVFNDSDGMGPLFFQFFPESISDDRQVDFNEQTLPFLTNPIPTFVTASPRTIGFTLQFAQELWIPTGSGNKNEMNWTKHNFNVGLSVQAVRSFAYPSKGFIPQPLLLTLPGTQIGIDGDSIYCLLKGYSTTYDAFFPDGQPRIANMNLTFQEFTIGIDGPRGNITKASFNDVYRNYSAYTMRTISNEGGSALADGKLQDIPIPGKTRNINSAKKL